MVSRLCRGISAISTLFCVFFFASARVLDPVAMKQILSALVPELGFLEAFASIFS
jgi:hypothetical protein